MSDWKKWLAVAFLGLCAVFGASDLSDKGYNFRFKDFFASKHDNDETSDEDVNEDANEDE